MLWNSDGCIIGGGTHLFECYGSPQLSYNEPCKPLALHVSEFDLNSSLIRIYPNPTSDKINLSTLKPSGWTQLKITNLQGQILFSKELLSLVDEEIDLTSFDKGQYLISIRVENEGVYQKKIVKY